MKGHSLKGCMFQMKDEKGPYLYAKNIISVGIDVSILNLDNDILSWNRVNGFI